MKDDVKGGVPCVRYYPTYNRDVQSCEDKFCKALKVRQVALSNLELCQLSCRPSFRPSICKKLILL